MAEDGGGDVMWSRETVPKVMLIVCSRPLLRQRELISLLLVNSSLRHALLDAYSLWQAIDLREMPDAGIRLIHALSLSRYVQVKHVDLEFARDVEDIHFDIVKKRFNLCLKDLEVLNLNGCQKISDRGIEAVTSICPNLKVFSIYWNVRVTDSCLKHLVRCCKRIVDLNLSGCKNISDTGLELVAANYSELESCNITRCIKVTDRGLEQIFKRCSNLQNLNLYALSSLTDKSYTKISLLATLKSLDLCGAQNLSDEALARIAKCKKLVSLNLTWCVRITDIGVIAIARGCTSLEFLSLFGIVGVTDKCLKVLSEACSGTMTTLDVNGCIGIKVRGCYIHCILTTCFGPHFHSSFYCFLRDEAAKTCFNRFHASNASKYIADTASYQRPMLHQGLLTDSYDTWLQQFLLGPSTSLFHNL